MSRLPPDRRCGQRRSPRDAGFTIVEVLVALAILAGAVGLAWRAVAGGWSAAHRSEQAGRAVTLAASLLETAGIEAPLAAGIATGRDGDIGWRLEIVPREPPASLGARPRVVLWQVTVETTWRDGPLAVERSVALTTLKLGGPP